MTTIQCDIDPQLIDLCEKFLRENLPENGDPKVILTFNLLQSLRDRFELNTRIRELENEKGELLEALDKLSTQIREQREHALRWIRERGYWVVPEEPIYEMAMAGNRAMASRYGSEHTVTGCYRAMLSAIDQDEIERELMK